MARSKEKHVKKKAKAEPTLTCKRHEKLEIKEKSVVKDPVADHVDIWVVRIMKYFACTNRFEGVIEKT